MTTSLQTDPRRAAAGKTSAHPTPRTGKLPLEMPVLFQLADLSLPEHKAARGKTQSTPLTLPPAVPPSEPAAVAEITAPLAPSVATAATVEPPKVEAPHTETAKPETAKFETLSPEAPKLALPQTPPAMPIAPPAIAEEVELAPASREPGSIASAIDASAMDAAAKTDAPIGEEKTADTPTGETAGPPALPPSATDVTPPTEPTAPSPRERAEQRAKSLKAPKGNDWMRTHGKFIAVGFVFALIATIYMARSGDEPAPANPNAATSEEMANQVAESEPKVTDAQTAKEVGQNQTSPALDETSPASAQVNLSPPKSANTIHEPTQPADVVDANSLFPWKGTGETRVATKPEGIKREESKPSPQAPAQERQQHAGEKSPQDFPASEPSIYGPPGSAGAAPQEEVQQATGEASEKSAAKPAAHSGAYREFEPPPSRPATESMRTSPRATPAGYEPASPNHVSPPSQTGTRHERIGSGVY